MTEHIKVPKDEWDELKERVRRLESRLDNNDTNHATTNEAGLDHRDAAVLDALEPGEPFSPIQLKRLYKRVTDIRNEKTAKERAKTLASRDCIKQQGRNYIYNE